MVEEVKAIEVMINNTKFKEFINNQLIPRLKEVE